VISNAVVLGHTSKMLNAVVLGHTSKMFWPIRGQCSQDFRSL